MEKHLEIEPAKKGYLAMPHKRLRSPEKYRRDQRADHNHGHKINRQSDCVFQA